MKSSPVKYLPLHPEIVAAATDADRIWDKTFCQIFRSGSDNEILGRKHLDGKAVSLEFVDSGTAKTAGSAIAKYQQVRDKLKYRFKWVPASEEKFKAYNTRSDRRVRVHSDDYIPGEFTEVLSDILWAAAHYCLVSSEMLSSMTAFVGTFSSFDVLAIDLTVEYETPDLRNIIALHKSLLQLARLLVAKILDYKPITIEVDGTVKNVSVFIDKNPVKLSPMQVRGVVAIALLEYDHWFSVDEFSKLITPNPKDRGEPRKEFDAALSVLKKFPPFGWDTDEGIRRITGAVIKSLVDKAVLQAFLNQKKNS